MALPLINCEFSGISKKIKKIKKIKKVIKKFNKIKIIYEICKLFALHHYESHQFAKLLDL